MSDLSDAAMVQQPANPNNVTSSSLSLLPNTSAAPLSSSTAPFAIPPLSTSAASPPNTAPVAPAQSTMFQTPSPYITPSVPARSDALPAAAADPKAINHLATLGVNTAAAQAALATLGSMTPAEAQKFGLGHLQAIGPGSSYSSPPQAFRPPTHVSQPPPVSVSPQSTTINGPKANAGSRKDSSPPSASSADPSGLMQPSASIYAASDSARAIPTNKSNPAFLNKLRSMVDDTQTDDLIRWSLDGSSFFVPNHVRFGDEVLPRFFKHNRFSSFVRQLNMYGFHKVPHLQQGALKHDSPTESELWEFSNPNFHRDHPDWLSRVQRKKGVRDHGEQDKEGSVVNDLANQGALTRTDFSLPTGDGDQGALQLTSVLNAINTIKNAQTSINTDLRHLQNSNQSLWQEAIESRQRAKRQQETINKILRFLAGVFGTQDDDELGPTGKVSSKGRSGRRVAVRPMRKGPLMIEDAKRHSSDIEEFELPLDEEEVDDMPAHLRFSETTNNDGSPKSNSPAHHGPGSSRFTALGSPPQRATELPDLGSEAIATPGGSRRLSSQAGSSILNAFTSGEGSAWLANLFGSGTANQGGSNAAASTPGGGIKLDPQMVTALQQALASGNTANDQDYLAGADDNSNRFSFASPPTNNPAPTPRSKGKGPAKSKATSSSSYAANNINRPAGLDSDTLSRLAGLSQALVHSPTRQQPSHLPNPHAGVPQSPNNQQVALSLARATRDLQGTASDANQVQNGINSLIDSLKLDPNVLQQQQQPQQPQTDPFQQQPLDTSYLDGFPLPDASQAPSSMDNPTFDQQPAAPGMESDFDVDSFLNQFVDSGGEDMGSNNSFGFSPATTAFLQDQQQQPTIELVDSNHSTPVVGSWGITTPPNRSNNASPIQQRKRKVDTDANTKTKKQAT